MSKELVRQEQQVLTPKVDRETIESFLFGSGNKLSEKEKEFFIQMALRNNLDPFKREIYLIKYGNGFNIVTGYQVYIQRAEATGLLNGWEVESIKDEKGNVVGAKITIYRKDWDKPFIWEVSRKEFDKGTGNWKTMPEFMIKKVAIGQGFRLAFPNELGGLPYLQEELEGVQPINQPQPQPEIIEPEVETVEMATQRQKTAIHTIAKQKGIDHKALMLEKFGVESTNDLTKEQASQLIDELQKIEEKEAVPF